MKGNSFLKILRDHTTVSPSYVGKKMYKAQNYSRSMIIAIVAILIFFLGEMKHNTGNTKIFPTDEINS